MNGFIFSSIGIALGTYYRFHAKRKKSEVIHGSIIALYTFLYGVLSHAVITLKEQPFIYGVLPVLMYSCLILCLTKFKRS